MVHHYSIQSPRLVVNFIFGLTTPNIVFRCSPFLLHPLPTSSPGAKHLPPRRFLHPPPAILCRSSIDPALCDCDWHHVPWLCAPPFASLGLFLGPCHPLGVLLSKAPPCLYAPASPSLFVPLSPCIFWCFVLCWVIFCARVRVQGTSTPWQSPTLVLAPPATRPCRHRYRWEWDLFSVGIRPVTKWLSWSSTVPSLS